MKTLKTLFLMTALVFSMATQSKSITEAVTVSVRYNDVSLIKIPRPRMPRKANTEPVKTSTGVVNISFENDFNDVGIYINKDGKEKLCENYPEIKSSTTLTYELNTWGKGTYIIEITTEEGVSVSEQIEFE